MWGKWFSKQIKWTVHAKDMTRFLKNKINKTRKINFFCLSRKSLYFLCFIFQVIWLQNSPDGLSTSTSGCVEFQESSQVGSLEPHRANRGGLKDFVVYFVFQAMDEIIPVNACPVPQSHSCYRYSQDSDIFSLLVKLCLQWSGILLLYQTC